MTTSGRPDELDVYDIAYLAGGPLRAVETAVVALVQAGRVRIHSPGQLATVDLRRSHPLEAAVLDVVGPQGHRSIDTIQWRISRDDRLLGIGRRLRGAGLLGHLGPTRAGRRALRAWESDPPSDPAEADIRRLAVQGRSAMADRGLCAAVFDRPAVPPTEDFGTRLERIRSLAIHDPELAAFDPRGLSGFEGFGGL